MLCAFTYMAIYTLSNDVSDLTFNTKWRELLSGLFEEEEFCKPAVFYGQHVVFNDIAECTIAQW